MKKTACYEVHRKLGGKIVDFAGWALPIQFEGILKEHEIVRTKCGIFDCSHMGQVFVKGEKTLDFFQKLISNNIEKIPDGKAIYSGMLNEKGGFVDDLIVYRISSTEAMAVINASNIEKDVAWMEKVIQESGYDLSLEDRSDQMGLLALQGPSSPEFLNKVLGLDLSEIKRFGFATLNYQGSEGYICRTGYTGEEGVELVFPNDVMPMLLNAFVESGVAPCGLGARDSLRLEKGYSLYGHEIDDTTNAIEAGLSWTVDLGKDDFIGKGALEEVKAKGATRKMVGFQMEGRAMARQGDLVVDQDGQDIGVVTSGTFSPTLKVGIGLAYVPSSFDTETLNLKVRKKVLPATVVTRNFI